MRNKTSKVDSKSAYSAGTARAKHKQHYRLEFHDKPQYIYMKLYKYICLLEEWGSCDPTLNPLIKCDLIRGILLLQIVAAAQNVD